MPRNATLAVIIVLLGAVAAGAATSHDPSSFEARAEILLEKSDSGLLPTPLMSAMLRDPYPEARALAVRVVASSSDPGQTLLLTEYLGDLDPGVRYQVMIAAGRLGEAGRGLALRGLGDGVGAVRQAAAWAACHGGEPAMAPLIKRMELEPDPGVRATAMANLWRFQDAGWEEVAARAATNADVQIRRAAAYSLGRSGRVSARPALRRLATDDEAVIRAVATAGLGRGSLAESDLAVLVAALADDDLRVRAAACGALAEQPQPPLPDEPAAAVAAMWASTDPHLAVMALRAAASRSEIGSDEDLEELALDEEPWLASEAFAALVGRGAGSDEKIAKRWLDSDSVSSRRAVAEAAPKLGREWERRAATDPEAAVRLAWLEALDPDETATRLELLRGLVDSDPDPMVRTAALNHLGAAGEARDFASLIGLYRKWGGDDAPDARSAALAAALAAADDEEQRTGVLELAFRDPNPAVGVLVVNAARSLGLPVRSYQREPRHPHAWYSELVDWMRRPHWLDVTTDRGTFRVRLDAVTAPITAREIYDLAAGGYYDGLTFHRVVPNFVVQGGDPRGDGWGGAGFILPDEPAFQPFDNARVGVATSGPNTGGGQLFVTLMPSDHLVGHYTNVGEVTAGREVLRRLRVGDRIRRIEVFSDDEPPPPTPVLLGELEWSDLESIPGWLDEYLGVEPIPGSLDLLATAAGSYRIVTVLGTWCSDSRREVPRLARVLDELAAPVFVHELIGVDPMRRIDDARVASAAGVERTVARVATIFVLDADGVELGRIVETAEKPIEELLVDFIAPAEDWQ
ncbi:MAG: HEAT repeat domain-containing protein [Thermoanaerobaculales bacterium]|jgi:cyclophilin family peptidyl-prolyl cis-trans isomerase/HEAT repeat protein|nr:HEAT repeat domain-containing protein [Thermoanaerobaculales bacterium]